MIPNSKEIPALPPRPDFIESELRPLTPAPLPPEITENDPRQIEYAKSRADYTNAHILRRVKD